ncbi:MAG: response regulator [Verrucomicrobiota bacterium]
MPTSPYDYRRYAILYVDDEEKSLKYFSRAFGDTFRILTAPDAAAGYRLLEQNPDDIGVLVSDQRMPGQTGVQLLERARRLRPRMIRILATAYSDLEAAIDAVNTGAIYKYVTKPLDVLQLETTLKRSLEFFLVQAERDLLLREKLSVLHQLVVTDRVLSLAVLAAGLGHQLRNSMEAVQNFLDLTPEMLHRENIDLGELRNPAFWRDFHRSVQGRVRQVQGLLTDLGEGIAPQPEGGLEEVRLRELLDQALAGSAEPLAQRRLRVGNDLPADLPPLRVDARKFRRLFPLLLRHELANLPEGAEVRITAALRPPADGRGPEVEVVVADNGPGLPEEGLHALYDPLRPAGASTGEVALCLMACHFIVYHHGGRIRAGGGPGRGLELRLDLPLAPGAPLAGSETQAENFLVRAMTNERLWERLISHP